MHTKTTKLTQRYGTAFGALWMLSSGTLALANQDDQLRTDWAQLSRYSQANAELTPPASNEKRVVFYGDSITDSWPLAKFFPGKPYVNRGISGQTTPQMLVRFRQDVLNLHPKTVVILAGTNDLARNTGVESVEQIEGYLTSMCELARANKIHVVLSSILPVLDYPWRPGLEPASKIAAINSWQKSYAKKHHLTYLDYFSALADSNAAMRKELSEDGVHPNQAGYEIMASVVAKSLGRGGSK